MNKLLLLLLKREVPGHKFPKNIPFVRATRTH